MFFESDTPEQIEKFGIALLTGKGKFHFIASVSDQSSGPESIRLMCRSGSLDAPISVLKKSRWFCDEMDAADRFRKNPNACHKCLRAMETIRFERERLRNFA